MGGVNPPSNVSVVVVSYNTIDKLRRCLSCIEPEHEVIVVDNASTDGSADMVASEFPKAQLIRNSENVGFGAANNQGMAVARRELVLFLNSDCYAEPRAIGLLALAFTGQGEMFGRGCVGPPKHWKSTNQLNVVAVGGMLLNPDGSLQESVADSLTTRAVASEQFFMEKILPSYWMTKKLYRESGVTPRVVPQIMGACLMIRPLARFDERFFLYCEDTDLCIRLRRHGEILWVPAARFTHELGSSSAGVNRWLGVARYNRGKELYFAIHYGWLSASACWLLDRIGALLRVIVWGIPTLLTLGLAPRFRNQVALFTRVLTAPRHGPRRPVRSGQ